MGHDAGLRAAYNEIELVGFTRALETVRTLLRGHCELYAAVAAFADAISPFSRHVVRPMASGTRAWM